MLVTGFLVAVLAVVAALAAAPPATAAAADGGEPMGGGGMDWTLTPQRGIAMSVDTRRATLAHLRAYMRALRTASCADVADWRARKQAVKQAIRAIRAGRTRTGCVLGRPASRALIAALSIAHPDYLCVAAVNATATADAAAAVDGNDGGSTTFGPLLPAHAAPNGCCRGFAPAAPGRCCAAPCPKLVELFPAWVTLPNCCATPFNDMPVGTECPGSMVYAVAMP